MERGPARKLLSLDGGGIKGISTLLILQEIMRQVAIIEDGPTASVNQYKAGVSVTETSDTVIGERRPIDYFDLTGGTSTGGIIAIMFGRLGLSCSEAITVYKQLSEEIFAIRIGSFNVSKHPILDKLFGKIILDVKMLLGSQFSAEYLDEGVNKILCQYIDPNDPCDPTTGDPYLVNNRYDPYNAAGKMLMCATMVNPGKALLFRDYTPPPDAIPETGDQNPDENHPTPPTAPRAPPYSAPNTAPTDPTNKCKADLYAFKYNTVTIKQAVRATSAAPTYLPPEEIQNLTFWDGGLLNNNPIDQVWSARYDLAQTCETEPYISTILSLGTTYSTQNPKPVVGLIRRLLAIVSKTISFASNVEAKALDFKRDIYRHNLRQPEDKRTCYFRLNAPTGDTVVDLADFQKIPFLIKKTEEYLACRETQRKIQACAELLAKRVWSAEGAK